MSCAQPTNYVDIFLLLNVSLCTYTNICKCLQIQLLKQVCRIVVKIKCRGLWLQTTALLVVCVSSLLAHLIFALDCTGLTLRQYNTWVISVFALLSNYMPCINFSQNYLHTIQHKHVHFNAILLSFDKSRSPEQQKRCYGSVVLLHDVQYGRWNMLLVCS